MTEQKTVRVVAAEIHKEGRFLITQRRLQKLRVNDWRFVAPSELDQYQFPAADFQTVQRLLYPNE